jgi:PD-(D/E)XK nuclease superfamily
MRLTSRDLPYVLPTYSLTGDLLAYLKCGLQYRYQNRGALPPSTPVQLWFGEFVHAVMEESFRQWSQAPSRFPWNWAAEIRPIELEMYRRLIARGLWAPRNLFCADGSGITACWCTNPSHRLLASERVEALINTWAPHLFPLISEAEVTLQGLRDMPGTQRRADYFEVTGTVDVLGSVQMAAAPRGNLLLHELQNHPGVRGRLSALSSGTYEVILDYKGMRRPAATSPESTYHEWQVLTYAWLRGLQAGASPVAAGVVLYVNELVPSGEDMKALKAEEAKGQTDIGAQGADAAALANWSGRGTPPALSTQLREARSIRVVPVDAAAMARGLAEFENVVADIEASVLQEMTGSNLVSVWRQRPSGGAYIAPASATCTACDHKHYCPSAATVGYGQPPTGP